MEPGNSNLDPDFVKAAERLKWAVSGEPKKEVIQQIKDEIQQSGWTIIPVGGLLRSVTDIRKSLNLRHIKSLEIEKNSEGKTFKIRNNPNAFLIWDDQKIEVATVEERDDTGELQEKGFKLLGYNDSFAFERPEIKLLIYYKDIENESLPEVDWNK
jgi:hypothetical protein